MIDIRRLTRGDASAFRALRLHGLKRHPNAFGASFDEESAQPLSSVVERLERDTAFGAFEGSDLLGVACFYALEYEKLRHKGVLYGMYVREAARRRSLGKSLVDAVLDHARRQVELVQLTAVTTNHAALRLYEKCGFKRYGVEPRALKFDDAYLDEVLMCRWLN